MEHVSCRYKNRNNYVIDSKAMSWDKQLLVLCFLTVHFAISFSRDMNSCIDRMCSHDSLNTNHALPASDKNFLFKIVKYMDIYLNGALKSDQIRSVLEVKN